MHGHYTLRSGDMRFDVTIPAFVLEMPATQRNLH
jgi:uncharacterized protein affecting Mg2+/Co2+ transport